MMTTIDEFHLWIVASSRTVCRVFEAGLREQEGVGGLVDGLRFFDRWIGGRGSIVHAILFVDTTEPIPDCAVWLFHVAGRHCLQQKLARLRGFAARGIEACKRVQVSVVIILSQQVGLLTKTRRAGG